MRTLLRCSELFLEVQRRVVRHLLVRRPVLLVGFKQRGLLHKTFVHVGGIAPAPAAFTFPSSAIYSAATAAFAQPRLLLRALCDRHSRGHPPIGLG